MAKTTKLTPTQQAAMDVLRSKQGPCLGGDLIGVGSAMTRLVEMGLVIKGRLNGRDCWSAKDPAPIAPTAYRR